MATKWNEGAGLESSATPARYDFLREMIQIVLGGELVDIHSVEFLPYCFFA
jgi:hypothetical protein